MLGYSTLSVLLHPKFFWNQAASGCHALVVCVYLFITRSTSNFCLNQQHHIMLLAADSGMSDCKHVRTIICSHLDLHKWAYNPFTIIPHLQLIGSLLWIRGQSQPKISQPIAYVSRFYTCCSRHNVLVALCVLKCLDTVKDRTLTHRCGLDCSPPCGRVRLSLYYILTRFWCRLIAKSTLSLLSTGRMACLSLTHGTVHPQEERGNCAFNWEYSWFWYLQGRLIVVLLPKRMALRPLLSTCITKASCLRHPTWRPTRGSKELTCTITWWRTIIKEIFRSFV